MAHLLEYPRPANAGEYHTSHKNVAPGQIDRRAIVHTKAQPGLIPSSRRQAVPSVSDCLVHPSASLRQSSGHRPHWSTPPPLLLRLRPLLPPVRRTASEAPGNPVSSLPSLSPLCAVPLLLCALLCASPQLFHAPDYALLLQRYTRE